MIRINLLPVKQIRKRISGRNEIIAIAGTIIAVIAALFTVHWTLANQVAALKGEIASLQKEKDKYSSLNKTIEDLKKVKDSLNAKIEVIKKLRLDSLLAVRVVDEVASRTPSGRLWLTNLRQSATSLQLDGVALDNATIAQYMKLLEASPYLDKAELSNSSLTDVAGQKLKSFNLTLTITPPPPPTAEGEKKP